MTRRIALLGRLAVDAEGPAIAARLPGRRAELVFAYLVAEHHRTVSQDELADALWPGTLPDTWAAALRGVISEVRRYLDDVGLPSAEVLATARRGYRLQLPPDVVVDLDEARDALARARLGLDGGEGAAAAAHASRAAALARLPFLPNHDGEWVDDTRRELASIYAGALEAEARGHAAAGDLKAAAAAAERLVRAEPFAEAGHQLRIRMLGEAGDGAGARRAFDHCRALLAEELGVEPSAETRDALELAVRTAAPPPPAAAGGRPSPRPPGSADTFGGLSVLVVEDHDFQRRTTLRLLQNLGVGSVSEAADGRAALELLAASPQPDVIICDIDMPGMDGVQFIRHVAERGLASAVVIASGLDAKLLDAVRSSGEAHGLQVLGALEKPLTPRRVGELLASYRRRPVQAAAAGEHAVTSGEVVAALAGGDITTVFEPTVDLGECRVNGAEAVCRWIHPDRGPIPSASFLPVLEADGLALRNTEAVLEAACAGLVRCRAAGIRAEMGVDLPSPALADVTLADRFVEQVRGAGAEASQVVWEVPEDELLRARPAALDVLTRLRVKGFGLAVDHFGTRRSSPDRLSRIPMTRVKVDASLVTGASEDRRRLALLDETFDIAQSLGVPVVATGCDSGADFDLVAEAGFRYAQGLAIGAPMHAAELVDWGLTWRPPVSAGGEPV